MLQFDGTSRMRGTPFRINENYLANYRTVSFKNTWCYSLCLWHDSLFSIFWCLLGQKQALLCIKLWGVCYNLVHNQTNASSGKMDEKLLQSLKLEKILCINEISCNYSQDKVPSKKLIVNAKQKKVSWYQIANACHFSYLRETFHSPYEYERYLIPLPTHWPMFLMYKFSSRSVLFSLYWSKSWLFVFMLVSEFVSHGKLTRVNKFNLYLLSIECGSLLLYRQIWIWLVVNTNISTS